MKARRPNLGELLDRAMLANTQAEADECYEAVRLFLQPHHPYLSADELRKLVLENIGYWASYSPRGTRARVEPFYGCEHPLFGSIAEYGEPTPADVMTAGMRIVNARNDDERDAVRDSVRAELKARKAGAP